MKKIFTTLALAAISMSGFAQATQEYMRVEFSVPITSYDYPKDPNKKGTALGGGQKDYYIYLNPLNPYLDFNISEHPLTINTTSWANVNEYTTFKIDQVRNTQTYIEDNTYHMLYNVDQIANITKYSIPVEKVVLMNTDTAAVLMEKPYIGNNEKFRIGKFTFNRLPRNVAELKTLIEPNGDGVRTHCHNPMFVAACMYLVFPRLLNCSQDCRDMIDYLHGKFDTPKVDDTYGISNTSFQDLCISRYAGNQGLDANGDWVHNHLFEYFEGATMANKWMPNGDASKGYFGQDSYTVYVAWGIEPAIMRSGQRDCLVATFCLISNPYATSKEDVAFEEPKPWSVEVRSTKKHGWYFHSKPETYIGLGKPFLPNPPKN